ncbi:hypothetical protein [Flavobacterium sp.]|uniref:hypothetical protein n=1 Tax=Flavobacterium sp. TaxID=239 RepID=UPI002B5A0909|nr:hypothetical protein [Flavobacterium sp.]HSD09312.1 hypothetical protein [Flavobacterium sp.]
MNKLVLFFGILTISYSTFAQSIPFKIQKSELFKDEYKNSTIVFTKENNDGGILIVRSFSGSSFSSSEGFYIENYNSNLVQTKKFEFDMKHPKNQKFNVVLGICSFENEIQIIEIYYDSNQKLYICQSNCIDEDFKITKKELFKLTNEEIEKNGSFTLESTFYNRMDEVWTNDNSGMFDGETDNFSVVNNQSLMSKKGKSEIIMTVNEANNAFAIAIDYNVRNAEYLKLYLFDNKLNKKIETEFSRDNIQDQKYVFQNLQVDPNGSSIYLLGKTYTDSQKKKNVGGKYLFELTKISSENQKSQFIDTKENFISSLKSIFHNNQLICIGFYSEINDSRYKGISCFKLDTNSLEILQEKHNPFSQQFMIDKYGEAKDKELKFLTFKNCFFTANNDLILNAQEEYSETSLLNRSNSMNGISNNQTIHHRDDIVSAKLSIEGDLIWARNINKKQRFHFAVDKNYASYTTTINGDISYYFINTDEKIKELKNDRIEFKGSDKSNLNLIRINNNGDFEYEKILDDEENEVPFMVANGISVGNSVFFLGKKGTTKQLLKVTL